MRKLIVDDLYLISEIFDKMDFELPDFKQEKRVTNKVELADVQEKYGTKIVISFFKKIYKAKNEVNQLIANVLEKDVKEVKKMSITSIKEVLNEIINSEDVKNFFSSESK